MEICRYLAMTRGEMEKYTLPQGFLPAFLPWEESPADLPKGTLLVLHDALPPEDPAPILEAVEKSGPCGILLDFQKPGREAAVKALCRMLPRPIAVSEPYAGAAEGAVFLPPCPPDKPLADHLAPWKHREIWLDIAPSVLALTLTEAGCAAEALPAPPDSPYYTQEALCCRYRCEILPDKAVFTLWRDRAMLEAHIRQAQTLGVTRVIGLFQEWHPLHRTPSSVPSPGGKVPRRGG